MAKSPTEQIRELTIEHKMMAERETILRRDLNRLMDQHEKLRESVTMLATEIALLRQRFDDHLKRVEEWDRRRWQISVLFVGSILTVVVNVFLTIVRR